MDGVVIPLQIVTLLLFFICVASFSMSRKQSPSYDIPLILFAIATIISFILNKDHWFHPRLLRLIAFIIAITVMGPIYTTKLIHVSRKAMFRIIFPVFAIMVIISLGIWLYTIYINIPISDARYYVFGFCGAFRMGMKLSPAAAIVAIWSFTNFLKSNKPKHLTIWAIISFCGILMCLCGGSRIASIGMILSLLTLFVSYLVVYSHTDRGKYIKIIQTALIFSFILISSPYSIRTINYKQQVANAHHSLTYSRDELWQNRISEFCDSPFFGIGYANEYTKDHKHSETTATPYHSIPGSAWLSLLSFTGICGTIPFLWFLISIIKQLFRSVRHHPDLNTNLFYLAMLIFLIIHGIAESWLFFSGGILFPAFWLTCSMITQLPSRNFIDNGSTDMTL